MPLDGITAKCLAAELSSSLADARLDRIHQPDRYDLFLQLRRGNENYRLLLSANPAAPRLHLTREIRENPSEPPMFCMLLRKHLAGARLLDVTTPSYERIFRLRFTMLDELGDRLEKTLVVEIMGRYSNIILLNQDSRILDAILHIDSSISRVREIMPARPYVLPPDQLKLEPQAALDLISSGLAWLSPASALLSLDKALLQTMQGFSPQLCLEVAYQAGLDPRLRAGQLDPPQKTRLDQALQVILSQILEGRFVPSVFYDSPQAELPFDFHALPLQSLANRQSTGSVSEAMDLYYLERSRQNTLKQKRRAMEKIIADQLDHARKKLLIHESDRLEGENRENFRLCGELILASIHLVRPGQSEVTVTDYSQSGEPDLAIALQANLTASQNAQRYFRLYNKARSKYSSGLRLAAEDQRDIAYLEALMNALAVAVEPDDLLAIRQEISSGSFQPDRTDRPDHPGRSGKPGQARQFSQANQPNLPGQPSGRRKTRQPAGKGAAKTSALPPRRYISSDGLTILAGRNNLQNDQLTLKTAQKGDIWLHVQKIPGTHVIIRMNPKESGQANPKGVPDQTLQEAAEIAAWFSRAALALPDSSANPANSVKYAGGPKVAVDYCPVSHVRKPAGARPGMVIYDHYQTILVVPKDPQALAGSAP